MAIEDNDFYEPFREAFEEMIGSRDETETYNGGITGNADDWIEIFSETGIVTDEMETDVEAFEEFLIAFFPQDKSPDEWFYDRTEFYYRYGINDSDIDWEYYREIVVTP